MRPLAVTCSSAVLLFLFSTIFLFPSSGFAQYSAVIRPVLQDLKWQKQEDYTESRLPAKLYGEMKKIVGSLSSWLQLGCTDALEGSPVWCGAYFSNKGNAVPLYKYEMRAGFYNGQAGNLNDEPGKEGRFVITANDLSSLQQPFEINGNAYLSVRPLRLVYQGIRCDSFSTEKEEGESQGRLTRSWLVSYAESLPYTLISREEYLEAAKKEIHADKDKLKEELRQRIPVKTAEEEESAKKREILEIENMYTGAMRDNRVRMYLASYKPDSVYFNEKFTALSAPLNADSLLLDSLVKKSSPDELARPAYVSVPAHQFRNFEDSIPGSRMLAKWNMNYFDKNISLARPQFLVITWTYDPADVLAAKIDRQFRERLEFCDLAALLGK